MAEVLAHLSHTEGHCYRMRVDRFLSEERPEFEADDAQFHLERYRDADPESNSTTSRSAATTTSSSCAASPRAPARRVALHQEAGEITLAQMLHEWALHDLGHIRQIAELVRARKYLPGAGPLGKDYRLNP